MKRQLIVAGLIGLAALTAQAQSKGGGSTPGPGVISIDQAKAEAGSVTAGDAPGFPVTISQPGSYRLMSNLSVSDPVLSGVQITSPNVTLDLNGFVIQGPINCTGQGSSLTCTSDGMGSNRGHGILVDMPNATGTTVTAHDGAVTGFAGHGVTGGGGYRSVGVHRLRISGNGWSGASNVATLTESLVTRNRVQGAAFVSRAVGNYFSMNREFGITNSHGRFNVSESNGGGTTYVYYLIE
jgi:hypothetical protein